MSRPSVNCKILPPALERDKETLARPEALPTPSTSRLMHMCASLPRWGVGEQLEDLLGSARGLLGPGPW